MKVIDCQGLGGSPTLGSVLEGFDLVHRVALPGGFGNDAVEANRHLLPGDWITETGAWETWTPQDGALLHGCPPCSGFSLLNSSKGGNSRGPESSINDCMKALIEYAGTCTGEDGKRGPQVVIFESVQGAFKQGRPLMQYLRDRLEQKTGEQYDLIHVLMSGASVGAAQYRRRYFFVAARVPFGIESPRIDRVRTYRDAMGDLVGLNNTWNPQRGDFNAWYGGEQYVDSHTWPTAGNNPQLSRVLPLVEWGWQAGESFVDLIRRLGRRPEWWSDKEWESFNNPKRMHINAMTRVSWDRPGYVITGGGGHLFLHPEESRPLSVREVYRLMGFPDSWTIRWAEPSINKAYLVSGKQVPVENTRWISKFARRAIEGIPGAWFGTEIGERERIVDVTNDYKRVFHDRTGAHVDSRNPKLKAEMESRPA